MCVLLLFCHGPLDLATVKRGCGHAHFVKARWLSAFGWAGDKDVEWPWPVRDRCYVKGEFGEVDWVEWVVGVTTYGCVMCCVVVRLVDY
jgi:hypothetical protein